MGDGPVTLHQTFVHRGMSQEDYERVTARRQEAKRLAASGMSTAEIACRLGVSVWTARCDLRRDKVYEPAPEPEFNDDDLDVESCRRMWGAMLVTAICDAMAADDPREFAAGATKFERQQAVDFIGSRGFHMACAFAGFDGDAVEDRLRAALNGTEADRQRILHRLTRGEIYFGKPKGHRVQQDTGALVAAMLDQNIPVEKIAERLGRARKTIQSHVRDISRRRAVDRSKAE